MATITKVFPIAGFKNIEYNPVSLAIYQYVKNKSIKKENTVSNNLRFTTAMFNMLTSTLGNITLQPMKHYFETGYLYAKEKLIICNFRI